MNTAAARQQMVDQQVRTWNVDDVTILSTLANLDRDQFVPPMYAEIAYSDTDIPLAHGQCMLRPTVEGRMLHMLNLAAEDSVLEVGTGTGYLTACLAKLTASVTSIDVFDEFIEMAQKNLARAEIDNVTMDCMDGMAHLPAGEFDAILVCGSTPTMEQHFVDALKPTGRLFAFIGESPVKQACVVAPDIEAGWRVLSSFETDVPTLINARPTPAFTF